MLQVHDFNPRSREGSDTIWSDIVSRTGISIRAPARGATTERSYLLDMDVISIRAPARGATNSVHSFFYSHLDFNPRSREGSDITTGATLAEIGISIRAPARGATWTLTERRRSNIFQSALPRGERRCTRLSARDFDNFNPRSREGSDDAIRNTLSGKMVFQSALPRGERHLPVLGQMHY